MITGKGKKVDWAAAIPQIVFAVSADCDATMGRASLLGHQLATAKAERRAAIRCRCQAMWERRLAYIEGSLLLQSAIRTIPKEPLMKRSRKDEYDP